METYSIILRRKFWFNRKLKKVLGHSFPADMNPGHDAVPGIEKETGKPTTFYEKKGPVKFMLITFIDQSREMINLDKFDSYTTSKELFIIQAQKAKEDSNNQVEIKA